jgi:fructose-bisphosphate aldolase class II
MQTLNQFLNRASKEHWAIGHFNVSNLEQLKAVVSAAKKMQAPVMIGTSEGERNWFGLENIVALVESFKKEWPNIFLNADHTKTVSAAQDAINTGFTSVHFDGSALSALENTTKTKQVADYAKSKNSNISVEGELGYVKGESQITGKRVELSLSDYTNPEEAEHFVKSTGVDRLAIAIGNIHGINIDEPKLDFEKLSAIRKAVPENIAIVLHAGSGIPDEDIRRAIECGISNIHISTELRVAFREGMEESLKDNPKEYAPYKLDAQIVEDMEELISEKIRLFGSDGKAML